MMTQIGWALIRKDTLKVLMRYPLVANEQIKIPTTYTGTQYTYSDTNYEDDRIKVVPINRDDLINPNTQVLSVGAEVVSLNEVVQATTIRNKTNAELLSDRVSKYPSVVFKNMMRQENAIRALRQESAITVVDFVTILEGLE